jgi:hypothetical protein
MATVTYAPCPEDVGHRRVSGDGDVPPIQLGQEAAVGVGGITEGANGDTFRVEAAVDQSLLGLGHDDRALADAHEVNTIAVLVVLPDPLNSRLHPVGHRIVERFVADQRREVTRILNRVGSRYMALVQERLPLRLRGMRRLP